MPSCFHARLMNSLGWQARAAMRHRRCRVAPGRCGSNTAAPGNNPVPHGGSRPHLLKVESALMSTSSASSSAVPMSSLAGSTAAAAAVQAGEVKPRQQRDMCPPHASLRLAPILLWATHAHTMPSGRAQHMHACLASGYQQPHPLTPPSPHTPFAHPAPAIPLPHPAPAPEAQPGALGF